MNTGEKIKYFRTLNNMTQKELGKITGIGEATIRKYELGIRNPKAEQLKKIADALGLGINAFWDISDTRLGCETVGDFIGLIIILCNSNFIEIQGERMNDGYLSLESTTIVFKENNFLSTILKFQMNNNQNNNLISIDNLSFKITNRLILNGLIKWEKINHIYRNALSTIETSRLNEFESEIEKIKQTKDLIELEVQRSTVLLSNSEGISVKMPKISQ